MIYHKKKKKKILPYNNPLYPIKGLSLKGFSLSMISLAVLYNSSQVVGTSFPYLFKRSLLEYIMDKSKSIGFNF